MDSDNDFKAAWLADSRHLINRLALLLMLILVASVVHTKALLTWPLATAGGCETAKEAVSALAPVCGLVDQMVTSYGVVATIVLGSILLPGVGLLSARSRSLAVEANKADPAKWLEEKNLAVSVWDQAGRLLVVLTPFLTGLIATFVTTATKIDQIP